MSWNGHDLLPAASFSKDKARREVDALFVEPSLYHHLFYCGPNSRIDRLEPLNFSARRDILVYRLKPWCIEQESADRYKSAVGKIELESYCACIVGKIDQNFRIDHFDPTSVPYRRAHPYATIQLQSFRQQCLDEIK
jgi:hypothetical protein